jgi:hypothetical protein
MTITLREVSVASSLVALMALGCSDAPADNLGALASAPVVAPVSRKGTAAPAKGKTTAAVSNTTPATGAMSRPVSEPPPTEPPADEPSLWRIMSLNIYGWATMPGAAQDYAALIEARAVDIVGIQEGVQDWQIQGWPTDYSRAEQLHAELGDCWQRRFQIFVNTCRGAVLDSHKRFDLTDGPNAVRTGEVALVTKSGTQVAFLNVHWDHESASARAASAGETAAEANLHWSIPTLVSGDFNSDCTGSDVSTVLSRGGMDLVVDGGIDCILARGITGSGTSFNAAPSDHPGLAATFVICE